MFDLVKSILKLIRVKQYTKNFILFLPFIFSGSFMDKTLFLKESLAFIGFCFLSSSVYIINDIVDIEKDRLDPRKRTRPLASNKISIKFALFLFAILFSLSFLILFLVNIFTLIGGVLYFLNNVLYSFYLKKKQLFDVFSIAFGFVIRVYTGAFAINVEVSQLLFLEMVFLSLYLGFGKRRYELLKLEDKAIDFKEVLQYYSVYYLDQLMLISASLSLFIYILYTLSFHNSYLVYSTIIATFGVFRYYHITHNLKQGEPSEELLNDKQILISAILLVIYDAVLIFSDSKR